MLILDDITGILPAEEAFLSGKLEMAQQVVCTAPKEAAGPLQVITTVLMLLFVVLTLFNLKDFIRMLPQLVDCLGRKSSCINIEHSVHTSRERNFSAFILALPFCLVADRLDLYRPEFLSAVPHGWMALVILGALLLYVLLRLFLSSFRKPYHISYEAWQGIKRCCYTYFIFTVVIVLATVGLLTLFHAPDATPRSVAYIEMGIIYLLSFVRTGQILSDYCNGFGTFLYLCALEIIPMGALIASAIAL